MTFSSRGIFQFDFDFSYSEPNNNVIVVKGFAFDFGHLLPKALKDSLLEETSAAGVLAFSMDNDNYAEILDDLESEYGVHDGHGFVDPAFISLAFSTYECERNRFGFLLQAWRDWFVKHCETVGDIRDLDPDLSPQAQWDALTS